MATVEQHRCQAKWARHAINVIERRMQINDDGLGAMLNNIMAKSMMEEMDVVEVYSPPRVVAMAKRMGLRAGWSLDLTTTDENGDAWDSNKVAMRNKAARKLIQDKPRLLIGSPTCTPFSQMNNINYTKMSREEVEQRLDHGRVHLEFCARLYEIQWREGRHLLHEHPQTASSWQERCIEKLMTKNGVQRVDGDQCMHGLKPWDGDKWGPARKRIGFMTNSPCIAAALTKRCPNTKSNVVHRHVRLESGRTKVAQIYPPELCQAICRGFKEQLEANRNGRFMLAELGDERIGDGRGMKAVAEKIKKHIPIADEDNDEEMMIAWDDVSGVALEPKAVIVARAEEIEYVRKMNVYTKVPIKECVMKTGKQPISTRWIDVNKGDAQNPNYRSRLFAREINTHKRDDLFAATPPLEALKVILSMTACCNKGEVVMINDISRALFHAKAKREVFVQIPQEDLQPNEREVCGRLNYSMYGTRDAAQNWFEEYTQGLLDVGFQQGKATPCVFYCEEKGIRTYVHGDDYVSIGIAKSLAWMKQQLEARYQVKTQTLGPEEGQCKEIKIINRIVRWCSSEGFIYEADLRHAELTIEN